MALVDLKSNLANFRSTFVTPSVESQAVKKLDRPSLIKEDFLPTDSRLDIDRTPTVYNRFTKFTPSVIDSSNFERPDSTIDRYAGFTKFTTRFINRSVYNIDTVPSKFSITGVSKLSDSQIVNGSPYNIDIIPDKYSNIGFSRLSVPRFINRSILNIDSTPSKYSNRGFYKLSVPRFINRSILNIDTIPSKFSITGVSKLSDIRTVNTSLLNVDSIPDKYSNVGFSRLSVPRFINRSILNIDSNPDKFSVVGVSKLSDKQIVNASLLNIDLTPSKFSVTGVSKLSNVDIINSSLFNVDTIPSKFSPNGIYSPSRLNNNTVVNASKFNVDTIPVKFAANGRFQSRYNPSSVVNDRINNLYKSFNERFNLRDTAFNYSYISHPLILRGIQRKEKPDPNRWGVDGLVNLDSGLVRGGITAAVDRVAADTARIAKWMSSPKGLLWVVKQIGLGLSNPGVEKVPGSSIAGIQQTRIHTGLAVLGSVPSHTTGIHLTRHGVPFLNQLASYEAVQKVINTSEAFRATLKTLPKFGSALLGSNRLLVLKTQLFHPTGGTSVERAMSSVLGRLNQITSIMWDASTKIGGAQSVYGIGSTLIRRNVDTQTQAIFLAKKQGFIPKTAALFGNYKEAYAFGLRTRYSTKDGKDSLDTPLINTTVSVQEEVDNYGSDFSDPRESIKYLYENSLKDTPDYIIGNKNYNTPYKPKQNTSTQYNGDEDAKRLIEFNNPTKPRYYVGSERAQTGKNRDVPSESKVKSLNNTVSDHDDDSSISLKSIYDNAANQDSITIDRPNSNVQIPNPFKRKVAGNKNLHQDADGNASPIKQYATMAYNKRPSDTKDRRSTFNDFRNQVVDDTPSADQTRVKTLIGAQNKDYYKDYNLEGRYGFSKAGHDPDVTSRGKQSFIIQGNQFGGTLSTFRQLNSNNKFTGDRITSLDYLSEGIDSEKIYENSKDFIKFYFADGDMQGTQTIKDVMVFRATITGFTDTFSPSWGPIQIMGRPDSVYRYESFERSISFSFKAYAMSRSEMVPMWRKLNYLASYTMPDFIGGYTAGPFMRLTLGDLFYNCPGFIESLSYTVPDDAHWDIGDDLSDADSPNEDAKQLPTMIDVSVGYKVIGTHRPLNRGQVYALTPQDRVSKGPAEAGDWLAGAKTYEKRLKEFPPENADGSPAGTLSTSDASYKPGTFPTPAQSAGGVTGAPGATSNQSANATSTLTSNNTIASNTSTNQSSNQYQSLKEKNMRTLDN